jgi:hypothetical protein
MRFLQVGVVCALLVSHFNCGILLQDWRQKRGTLARDRDSPGWKVLCDVYWKLYNIEAGISRNLRSDYEQYKLRDIERRRSAIGKPSIHAARRLPKLGQQRTLGASRTINRFP